MAASGGGGRAIRVLNVAEKPSVAKTVSGILSRNQGLRMREGRSRYNKIFEFNYAIQGQPCQMMFTSVTGHLMEMEFEGRYRKWHSCDPVDLFEAPIRKHVPEDKLDIRRTLEEEARKCQWLVLWLDCDREGENIAYEVVEVCLNVNSHLNIWRARFSSLIDREIHQAAQQLARPNQLFSEAVDVRQEIDLRIGASFTRFQTMLLKDAFDFNFSTDGRNLILSYGPCQFPTLGFVVERYWEIQAHEPEEFWKIQCSHTTDEGTANFNWMRGHLFDYTCAVLLYEMCFEEPIATVTKVRKQEKLKYPPHPLNTIELEKRASRYFRMSSEQTMKIAEDLYQSGFISYPRTETDSFSTRTDLHILVQEQQEHPVWGPYAQRLLDPSSGLWRNPSGGGHDDKAHPPIHPTKFSAGESRWSEDHKKLYELVVRHYLACVSQPAVGAETTVEIDIAGEMFSALGRTIVAKNYLEVYRFESWGGSLIPNYTFGQQFTPTSLTLESGITRPPPLLSESDLLDYMDKAGIGTDATMHDHIKKLTDRFYAIKEGSHFKPTNLGEALVMGYDDMGYELWKPYLRSMMEEDMKAVSIGNKRKDDVLATCLQQMKACFLDARVNKTKLFQALEIFFDRTNRTTGGDDQHNHAQQLVRKCDVCHDSDLVLRKKPDGKFMIGCSGYPQCRNVIWLPGSISEAVVTTTVCNMCTPGPVFKIQFTFRRLEIPPNFNVHHLGCVGGCDDIMRQLIEMSGSGQRNTSSTPARGRGIAAPSRNDSRNNNNNQQQLQQATCSFCHQTGHNSSDCYSLTSQNRSARSQRVNSNSGDSPIPCPTCGSLCVLKTANTESNRGRKFYSCQTQGCKFFVCWEDSVPTTRGGGSGSATTTSRRGGRGGGRGGGGGQGGGDVRFVSATGDPVSGRSCFICGDPSHFANACPNRGMRN
ncbi:putative DNA topoisomerase transcription factor interactor and regulator CCHC(Zn) family [Helianthus annuus]|uniref:DNA topoisomerase 3-alpha n=1 Tax=Helianthus annuus TaxID=4232 RepID=UPI000B8F01FD|nr:DNA topoisomerase 3-alpha [Helianthus annuus]KAJ0612116.1 putative DNA topoisomerase transcription factor interactor and regulator CCHC(Zn) family [Helianthus annuus]KAJ0627471.1 putative DNA topoisomerase transcription factor interactor and regulator CCHC(Zn) family [Helianthus annuus]KAJ0948653.1 putative DNA topoisomerase transcription factor interactor and regulator CCHC(Zn) family [Helianthus annuus]